MNLLARWAAHFLAGEAADRSVCLDGASRPRSGRFGEVPPTARVVSRFSMEFRRWLAINYWTPPLFAALTVQSGEPSLALSAEDINAILCGSRLDLMPRHFRAFAAVERLTRAQRMMPLASDRDLIACFTSSICVDDSALQPSWWFAVYGGEDWALQKLHGPAAEPLHGLAALRRLLPPLLRNAIVANGLDPVAHLKASVERLPGASALRPHRFVDWILESDRLDDRELRLAIAFLMLLMSELGLQYQSLLDVSVVVARPDAVEASRQQAHGRRALLPVGLR